MTAVGHRSRLAERARYRIALCAIVFFAAYGALTLRLAVVTLGGAPQTRIAASAPEAAGPRPELVDRNGVILATNLPLVALEIAGREVWDARDTARRVAALFPDVNEEALAADLAAGRYTPVLESLTPAQQDAAFALGLPGVKFRPHTSRFYPQQALAAHVVGHTEPGKGGVMGLERTLDRVEAAPLAAAIDIRVQQALEDELAAEMDRNRAEAAWGVVMDVATGEIIALASLPDFDPNAPGAVPADRRRNRATYDRYELGSAFKAFTAAAALEAGVAEESSTYDARGSLRVADKVIRDFHGENRVLTLSEVVQYSSNIGAARLAGDLGVENQKAALKSLGFFEPVAVELAENRPTELPRKWGPVESATISYGHGISVTPLHLIAAFTAVVNGGVYRTPTLIAHDEPGAGRKVFSPETSKIMRRILRRAVTDGTASYAEADGYFPIGKTATAEKPNGGRYAVNERITSFVGAFPGYAPRYSVLVSFDNPQPTPETYGYATAGWNAAPAFSRVVKRIAPTLNIMPTGPEDAFRTFGMSYVNAMSEPGEEAAAGGAL